MPGRRAVAGPVRYVLACLTMLKLGHISYSNCVPVHGRFLECGAPPSVAMVHGVPRLLNSKLAEGAVDVAPASSIEFARYADRYRILPDLSISARGPVQTIQLVSRVAIDELGDGSRLAVPTASATSVVLLKIIMQQRFGIRANYVWFEQEADEPLAAGADAALYIGDQAYRQRSRTDLYSSDLAEVWSDWTGLPFVFALWQTAAGPDRNMELRALGAELLDSRQWSLERLPQLADRYAGEFGWSKKDLVKYWHSLSYDWSDDLEKGLEEFYRRAVGIGEIGRAPSLAFLEP